MSTVSMPGAAEPESGTPAASPATSTKVPTLRESLRRVPSGYRWAALVAAVAIAVVWYIYSGRVTTDDAQVDSHISAMASQVSGYVVKLNINDNTVAKQGDVLIEIDPRPYQAIVDQARAALDVAKAEANSARLQIGLTRDTTTQNVNGASAQKESDAADYASSQALLEQTATANLQQAEANVAAKQAVKVRAQADLERYTPLLTTGDVSKFQYDAAEAAARVAKSELAAAEQQLKAAQQAVVIAQSNAKSSEARLARAQSQLMESKARVQQVPITEATFKSALAAVERAQAALEQAELNLGYTKIVAPIDGQIAQKTVQLGQYVSPGELLFTLVPMSEVYVTANFKETQLAKVWPGQRAKIRVDTYDKDLEGVVDSIAGATGSRQALLPPQNATGNFVKVVQRIPVKILVKPSKDAHVVLRPGMNVEATIYTR